MIGVNFAAVLIGVALPVKSMEIDVAGITLTQNLRLPPVQIVARHLKTGHSSGTGP